jgi:hypothetical protein
MIQQKLNFRKNMCKSILLVLHTFFGYLCNKQSLRISPFLLPTAQTLNIFVTQKV